MVTRFIKNNMLLFLLAFLCVPTILALFYPGFFISDDGEWMIIRLSAFYENLRAGEVPVRYISRLNNGYGYPLANFMYPGFLYLGSVIHLLGFGFITTIKIIFGASMIFSGVFTYFWLQKLFSKIPSFFGALLYVYMPYHLFDMYTRGSIGEMLALCIIPFVFWQIERKDIVLTAVGIAMLILAHNTLAFLFAFPLFLYIVIRSKEKMRKSIVIAGIPLIVGAFLSSFFWIPALFDLQYTKFRSVTISEWEKYFSDFGLLGIATLVVIAASCIHIFQHRAKTEKHRNVVYAFIFISITSIFIALPISSFLWNSIPSSLIQFPFRVLSLVIPLIAFLTAFLLSSQNKKKQIMLGVLLSILACVSSYAYMFPKGYTDKDDMYYITNFSTTTVKDEYMPIWVKEPVPASSMRKVEIISGKGSIANEKIKGNNISFTTHMETDGRVQINTVYFPGWKAMVENKEYLITYNNKHGLIHLALSPGEHTVTLTFTETPVRIVANILSLVTVIILLVIFFKKVRYNAIRLS